MFVLDAIDVSGVDQQLAADHFTEKALRVVLQSAVEAGLYGSRSIETEHMLLGLFRDEN